MCVSQHIINLIFTSINKHCETILYTYIYVLVVVIKFLKTIFGLTSVVIEFQRVGYYFWYGYYMYIKEEYLLKNLFLHI